MFGFLKRLFGRLEEPPVEALPDLKVPESFWSLIHQAKSDARSCQRLFGRSIEAQLLRLPKEGIQQFDAWLRERKAEANSWELWGAAYVINGGCGDDSFDYFRNWLVSQGENVFQKALSDPDGIADLEIVIDPSEGGPCFEELAYIAADAYKQKSGEEMPYSSSTGVTEPSGTEWDEDGVEELYPKLNARFWPSS